MSDIEPPSFDLNIGPIGSVLLLGGGRLLREICLWARRVELPVSVITGPRHLAQLDESISLGDFLSHNQISYLCVERMTDPRVEDFVADLKSPFCLSLGAPWIFSTDLIRNLFGNMLFNLHGARLPQNRGGGGFSWQILTGNRFGYCVLHRVDGGIDTGEIICSEEFLYPASARLPIDYERIYFAKNLDFVLRFLSDIRQKAKKLNVMPQVEWFSTYWPRLNTDLNGWIDWSMKAGDLERFICAFDAPYSGARTYLKKRSVRVRKAMMSVQDGEFHPFQRGLVYRKGPNWICVAIRGGSLIVEEVVDDSGQDLLDRISLGDRFVTPVDKLESGLARPVYDAKGLV